MKSRFQTTIGIQSQRGIHFGTTDSIKGRIIQFGSPIAFEQDEEVVLKIGILTAGMDSGGSAMFIWPLQSEMKRRAVWPNFIDAAGPRNAPSTHKPLRGHPLPYAWRNPLPFTSPHFPFRTMAEISRQSGKTRVPFDETGHCTSVEVAYQPKATRRGGEPS